MKKTVVATLVLGALISSLAMASEETKYVTDQSADGHGSMMVMRASTQIAVVEALSVHPLLGLLLYSSTVGISRDINIKDLDTLSYVKMQHLMELIQAKLEILMQKTFDASSKVSDQTKATSETSSEDTDQVTNTIDDILQKAAISFAKKVKGEKAAFYANGKVDVAQTPTLFGAANQVAQTKGVDANVAAAVIIANCEALLDRNNL